MRFLLLPLLLASMTLLGAADDKVSLSGKWQVHVSIAGNESDQNCTLTQEGTELSGTCVSEQATVKISGKVEDQKVTWSYKSEYNGSPLTVQYSGSFDGSAKITGSVLVPEYSAEGDFTATLSK